MKDECYVEDKKELKQETFSSHGRPSERKLFSYLTCPHTTTYVLLSIFSLVETISLKIWERPLSWHAKSLPSVPVRGSKASLALALLIRITVTPLVVCSKSLHEQNALEK